MRVGMQIVHNGAAIELLHLRAQTDLGELWRVKPLFVDDDTPVDVFIAKGARYSPIHSERIA